MSEDLETKCATCDGRKHVYDSETDSFNECRLCNGSGLTPTRFGARILDLVRHNSRVSAELQISCAR